MKEKITKRDSVPFTQVANSILRNKNLSLKAKGLWSYLYSKPEGWNYSYKRIADESQDGIDAVLSGLKELEEAGYLTRTKRADGFVDYAISWTPSTGKARLGKSLLGKTPTNSNIVLNTSNKEEIPATPSVAPIFESPLPKADDFFDKRLTDDGIPMTQNEFVLLCRGASQRKIRVIAEYTGDADPKYNTRGQWREFGRRNFRAAQALAPYTDKQIERAFEKMSKDFKSNGGFLTRWTLETLVKYLD